jgi:hypothetical protein
MTFGGDIGFALLICPLIVGVMEKQPPRLILSLIMHKRQRTVILHAGGSSRCE